MCGIAGVFAFDRQRPVDVDLVRRMTETIQHRGPDGDGVRIGPGYVLGHRRRPVAFARPVLLVVRVLRQRHASVASAAGRRCCGRPAVHR